MNAPPDVRPAAVAGLFYPGEAGALGRTVDRLLAEARPQAAPARAPKALIVPHAGFAYSGPVAARAYAHLAAAQGEAGRAAIRRVVLVGPAHRLYVRGLADPGADAFATPLGAVEVDRRGLDALPGRTDGRRAHVAEHSLEVQLPFVQRLWPDARIVPFLCCDTPPEAVARGLERLWGGPETLVLISTDLSHFHPYREAARRDLDTALRIEALDEVPLTGEEACGASAVNGLLSLARERRLGIERLDLRSSGDTQARRSDAAEVVGYGAWALNEPGAPAGGAHARPTH